MTYLVTHTSIVQSLTEAAWIYWGDYVAGTRSPENTYILLGIVKNKLNLMGSLSTEGGSRPPEAVFIVLEYGIQHWMDQIRDQHPNLACPQL